MKKKPVAVLVGALLLGAASLVVGRCFADERLAWDSLASAKVGDWAAYKRTDQGMRAGGNHPHGFLVRVAKIGEKEITLAIKGPGAGTREVSFVKGEAPALDAIARALEPHVTAGAAAKVVSSDVKLEANGKEIDGKKIVFQLPKEQQATLEVAKDVKVLGVFSLFWDGNLKVDGPGTFFELAGQGTEKATEWGKTFEDLEAADAGKK